MNGLILAAQVENVSTRRDGTIKLVFGTQEIAPTKAGELVALNNKMVCLYVSPKETLSQKEIDQVDQIDPEFGGKTQSQRLRNTLFVLWQKTAIPDAVPFDDFYHASMESFINSVKVKIPAA